MGGLLSKERIVAGPGFNRWWIVVAALAINLCIGSAYAFSVFNLPLTRVIGITAPASGDWKLTELGWVFTLAFVFLGLSAGFAGSWQDRVGPRVSALTAAACFGGGLLVAAAGVGWHQLWLLYAGYGVIGGCGLGIGFNTPISTLVRWFPDHRGLATGLAIMGFGGGAIIAAPMSLWLMRAFASPSSVGVVETFLVLGAVYFCVIFGGALLFRLPPPGWRPAGWRPPPSARAAESLYVPTADAVRTRQFYLLWCMLLINVTAGIGVLGQAAAMVQEVFGGVSAQAAAWFVAILSLFNMAGRLLWASVSDVVGRRTTFALFFSLGPLLYAAVPFAGRAQSLVLFVACFAVILSMYGGGFASMPPYIADLFGSRHVGAINGRVLTALSVAGVLGPAAVNYLREYWLSLGAEKNQVYDQTLWLMAGWLLLGLACNAAIRPVPRALFRDDPASTASAAREEPADGEGLRVAEGAD